MFKPCSGSWRNTVHSSKDQTRSSVSVAQGTAGHRDHFGIAPHPQTGQISTPSLSAVEGQYFVGRVVGRRIPGTGGLERVVFNERLWELGRETILQDLHQRIRDVRQGPMG